MKFNINDPESHLYAVYLNDKLQKNAIEADPEIGKIRLLETVGGIWGMSKKKREKVKYGKVFVVRMEGFEVSYYRSKHLIDEYYNPQEELLLPETD